MRFPSLKSGRGGAHRSTDLELVAVRDVHFGEIRDKAYTINPINSTHPAHTSPPIAIMRKYTRPPRFFPRRGGNSDPTNPQHSRRIAYRPIVQMARGLVCAVYRRYRRPRGIMPPEPPNFPGETPRSRFYKRPENIYPSPFKEYTVGR